MVKATKILRQLSISVGSTMQTRILMIAGQAWMFVECHVLLSSNDCLLTLKGSITLNDLCSFLGLPSQAMPSQTISTRSSTFSPRCDSNTQDPILARRVLTEVLTDTQPADMRHYDGPLQRKNCVYGLDLDVVVDNDNGREDREALAIIALRPKLPLILVGLVAMLYVTDRRLYQKPILTVNSSACHWQCAGDPRCIPR